MEFIVGARGRKRRITNWGGNRHKKESSPRETQNGERNQTMYRLSREKKSVSLIEGKLGAISPI